MGSVVRVPASASPVQGSALAYVFWHLRRPEVNAAEYEERLATFHLALAAAKPEGFLGSAAFRIAGALWLADGGYEDRYLLDGFAALDALNRGAVSGDVRGPHDASARLAAGGTAGLYALVAGDAGSLGAVEAAWFAKPEGETYEGFQAPLERAVAAPGAGVWQRQMVLGPTPEFCLLGGGLEPAGSRPVELALLARFL